MANGGSGTVAVNITYNDQVGFIYQETSNDTGGAVAVNAGKRLFKVFTAGTYTLNFTATNFSLADPPIGFPGGQPPWLTLQPGYGASQFSVETLNSGTVENQTGSFLVHKAGGEVVDPTVVNNPNPPEVEIPWLDLPEAAYCRNPVQS